MRNSVAVFLAVLVLACTALLAGGAFSQTTERGRRGPDAEPLLLEQTHLLEPGVYLLVAEGDVSLTGDFHAATWEPVTAKTLLSSVAVTGDGETVYVTREDKLWRSTDAGESFAPVWPQE